MFVYNVIAILYNRKFSRIILNFAVFPYFTAASQLIPQNLTIYVVSKFNSQNLLFRDNFKNFLPQKFPSILYS